MPRSGRQSLSTVELGAVAEAALLNSLALLEDADLLAEHAHCPRSFDLAVLAGEEFGKVMMCLGALGHPEASDGNFWDEFWDRFVDHKPKYENVFGLAASFIDDPRIVEDLRRRVGDHMRADQERKLDALYVDYRNAALKLPWVLVNEHDVRAILTVFGTTIRTWVKTSGGPHIAARIVESEPAAREFQAARATGDEALVRQVLEDQFRIGDADSQTAGEP